MASALAGGGFSRRLDTTFALTNRLRTAGTDHLLAAARAAGGPRFVARSFTPYRYAHQGGPVATEATRCSPIPRAARARRSTPCSTSTRR